MKTLNSLYLTLNNIARNEAIIERVTGEHIELFDERIEAKREIRSFAKSLRDPLAKSLRDGAHRTCGDGDIGYYEWWYEQDDPTMTDDEVAEYVDSEYRWYAGYPGGTFTHVYWARTPYGLRIITHTSLDV